VTGLAGEAEAVLWLDGQSVGDDLDPSLNVTPRTVWQLVVAIEKTPAFCRDSRGLKTIASAVVLGQAALRSDSLRWAHGSEGAFNGIGRPQVVPCSAGKS